MASSPARQRNAVSEGFALGLVTHGRTELPFRKVELDLAFEGAWRTWSHRGRFRQVNTDLANGLDAVWAFTRADAAKRVLVLYWERTGSDLRIVARQPDWSADDASDLAYASDMIDGDVPLSGWETLAAEFLARFER